MKVPFIGGIAHGEVREVTGESPRLLPRYRVPVPPEKMTLADVIGFGGDIDYKEGPRFDCHDYLLHRRGEYLWYQWDESFDKWYAP